MQKILYSLVSMCRMKNEIGELVRVHIKTTATTPDNDNENTQKQDTQNHEEMQTCIPAQNLVFIPTVFEN